MNAKIGFLGAGNIVSAILSGIEKSGKTPAGAIAIYEINKEVRAAWKDKGYIVFESIAEIVNACRYIVFAVKPQVMPSIMPEVKAAMNPEKALISVAAGLSSGWFREQTGFPCKILRCMPNTPAALGLGAMALSWESRVPDEDVSFVKSFFEGCGVVEVIPDNLMSEATPISGSMPAVIYRFASVVTEEAARMGIDEDTALRLFCQTLKGSAQMLLNSGHSAKELEEMVCSPGGTTLAMLGKMDEFGFGGCVTEGMRACVKRYKELSK
jgi:pyrroline-5-carboxylate reductase